MAPEKERPSTTAVPRGRCVCGHFPSNHMLVRPVGLSANFRLDPSGPCSVCGEATCRAYAPAGPDPPRA